MKTRPECEAVGLHEFVCQENNRCADGQCEPVKNAPPAQTYLPASERQRPAFTPGPPGAGGAPGPARKKGARDANATPRTRLTDSGSVF